MVMKYLQRLGKSLMLPIAVLPVCAILMGIGYAIDKNVMAGGDVNVISLFLVKVGGSLIDNMAILFAIGVAVGMSDDQHGGAALAGLVSWLVVTTLLSSGTVTAMGLYQAENQKNLLASFAKIQNQFIGILTGLVGAHCYNFFKNTKLPAYLGFFSGRRSVAIVTTGVSMVLSLILLLVWPYVYFGLVKLGEGLVGIGAIGAGLYGFFNRLLIPIGLHHALNSVFWFDVASISDIHTFWLGTWENGQYVLSNGMTSVLKEGQAGMYQAGFFPIMMFGLPGAGLAMYMAAKPDKKKSTLGIIGAAAFASFLTGVTEPLEFSFMFLAPVLYGIHAVLTGICVAIVAALPVRAGFWFSAGLVDYIFSIFCPNARNIWALPLIGLGFFAIYFVVFYFVIVKLDLMTPGREDDDEDETKVVLANNDYTTVASIILKGLGGKENVKSLDNCVTRLRLEIKDYTQVDEKLIKSAGVKGVIRPSKDSVQVIVGPLVQFVADEMKKML